jgi:hypothetical protein
MSDAWRRVRATASCTLATSAVCGSILAAGCASSDQDDEAARWAREVRVLRPEQVGDRGYDVVGQLEERVAIGVGGEDGARSAAEQRLRYRAAKLDADALVMIGCNRIGDARSPARPTGEFALAPTLVCQGVALRWHLP